MTKKFKKIQDIINLLDGDQSNCEGEEFQPGDLLQIRQDKMSIDFFDYCESEEHVKDIFHHEYKYNIPSKNLKGTTLVFLEFGEIPFPDWREEHGPKINFMKALDDDGRVLLIGPAIRGNFNRFYNYFERVE